MDYKTTLVAIATALGLSAGIAQATTVEFASPGWTYNNPGANEQVDWRVSVNDDTAGILSFDVSIDAGSSATGDILGFAFDLADAGLTQSDISNFTSSTGEGITGFFTDSTSCGNGGCNWNGATSDDFDYILRVGAQGSANGSITSLSFDLDVSDTFMLSTSTLTRVGIRSQSLGAAPNGGGGSSKDINTVPNELVATTPIPLPAGAWLLLTAMGGLGVARLRKRSA
ncbi:VPLPA-CTERM sorting domain-containing protein [Dinoroseobacter sp. S375]|uniref:VPLPA-CTERM sorting domain-containing protein n=1 Tax=Dinoroseobacter sp. S375 TaxID=3415136 RepID=UPI003C7CA26E